MSPARARAWLLAVLAPGCIELGVYQCEQANACGTGVCEPSGYCSYEDETCDSGRRYSELAAAELARTCVEPDPADTGPDDDDDDDDSGGVAECGNGIVETGEDCDDGDTVEGNGCNADCRESGRIVWTAEIAGAGSGRDTGWAVGILGSGDVIAGGAEEVAGADDMLLARFDRDAGTAVWTWRAGDDEGPADDRIEAVTITAIGQVVAGGIRNRVAEPDSAWVGAFDADGESIFEDHPPGYVVLGLTTNAAGFIAAGAGPGGDGSDEGVVASYWEGATQPVWVVGSSLAGDDYYTAVDRIAEDEVVAIGVQDGQAIVDRISSEGVTRIATLDAGDGPGFAQSGLVDGSDVIIAGFADTTFAHDAWLARLHPDGSPAWNRVDRAVDLEVDEELEGVALDAEGNLIAAGFVTLDAKQARVCKYDPAGEPLWIRDFDQPGSSVARAVDVDGDGYVAITGETIGADGTFDFWVARLAP